MKAACVAGHGRRRDWCGPSARLPSFLPPPFSPPPLPPSPLLPADVAPRSMPDTNRPMEYWEEGGGGRVAAVFDSLDAEEQDQFVAVLSRICRINLANPARSALRVAPVAPRAPGRPCPPMGFARFSGLGFLFFAWAFYFSPGPSICRVGLLFFVWVFYFSSGPFICVGLLFFAWACRPFVCLVVWEWAFFFRLLPPLPSHKCLHDGHTPNNKTQDYLSFYGGQRGHQKSRCQGHGRASRGGVR